MTLDHIFQAGLVLASSGLAIFCLVLARRLRRLNDLETGLGGAIAVMAAEVDRLDRAMSEARDQATAASEELSRQIVAARKEREAWDLRQKIGMAAMSAPPDPVLPPRGKRLRKRVEFLDA